MTGRQLPKTAMIDGRCYDLEWSTSDNMDGFVAIVSLNSPSDGDVDLKDVSIERALSCAPLDGIDSISAHGDGEVILYVHA